MSTVTLDQELNRARAALTQQNGDEAETGYRAALALAPDNAEALNFLGTRATRAGRHAEAIELLERAHAIDPSDPNIGFNLGLAYLVAEQLQPSLETFQRTLAVAPQFFLARLHYGRVLELVGREAEAVPQYYAAIMRAQTQGRWLNDATTAPVLRDIVKHCMFVAQTQRKRLFESVLDRLRDKHGADALRRAYKSLAMLLGEIPTRHADARQVPKFLYFPDLPTSPYFARELFPWYAMLEDNFDAVRAELAEVLRSEDNLEPFLKLHSSQEIAGYLGGEGAPKWDAFFFYRHGQRYDDNCARCPKTAAILDALPTLARVRDHAPEVCFSVLTPGSHILPHRGVTNTRLVTHFPLVVPAGDLALRVGGEAHVWQEGRCVTFDDTFEHEAWNRTGQTRVVMLLDVWNPHLTEIERDAVAALVETVGDFNRAAEVEDLTQNH